MNNEQQNINDYEIRQENSVQSPKLSKKERGAYIWGMLGQNIIYGIVTSGLTFYYQSVIFLPALFISILTICIKIIDIIKDPFIGAFMDAKVRKRGKFIPYLRIVPVILVLLTVSLFVNKIYSSSNSTIENVFILVWAAASYLFWSVVYTFGDIPINSLPALMTSNTNERNSIVANSKVFATIGVGLISVFLTPAASFLGNLIFQKTGNRDISFQYGFLISVSVLAIIGFVLFQLTGFFVKENQHEDIPQNRFSFRQSFKTMWSCKSYNRLIISCILRSPTLVFTIVQITMFVYYFGNNDSGSYVIYLIAFSVAMFLGQGISMLFTPKLAQKINKNKLMIFSNLGQGVSLLLIFALYMIFPHTLNLLVPFILLSVIAFLIGIFSGVINVLIPILIADSLDNFEMEMGQRPDGVFFSGMTMVNKLSYGIGAVIVGVVFAVIGFSGNGVQKVNEALYSGANFRIDSIFQMYRTCIFALASIPPAIGSFISVFPFIFEVKAKK